MTLTIIDTFGFLFSNYYALQNLKTSKGFPTGMITGFMNFIANLGKDYKTDYILFSLDSKGESFRNRIYPQYKANRKEAEEELLQQLPICLELIKEMGFKSIEKERYESDDIITSITKIAKEKGIKVIIVSHDKDMYQLVDDDMVVIYDPRKKVFINEEKVIEKFGVPPKDFVDFQALIGDSSDNVPGVRGIGPKTASKLINKYHTLEEIYAHIDEIKGAVKKRLLENRDIAFLSRELVKLKDDLFEQLDLEEFKYPEVNPILKIKEKLLDLELKRVVERVEREGLYKKTAMPKENKIEIEYQTITDEKKLLKIVEEIENGEIVAIDTETNSLNRDKRVVGYSFSFKDKNFYVPINHFYLGVTEQIEEKKAISALKKLIEKSKIVGHNLKFDLELLYRYGVEPFTPFMDTMILAWILDPDQKVGLDSLAKRYFNYETIKFKNLVKKGENFSFVEIEEASKYASQDSFLTLKLYYRLSEELKSKKDWNIEEELVNVELPFINLLINMERRGIKIDIDYFKKLEKEITEKIEELKEKIFQLAEEEFNLNSPQQVGYILFEKLKIPTKKKTKTGYSTSEEVLKKISEYEIVKYILKYRELFKLLSTYIKPLPEHAIGGRIYTHFLQTGTATGRLSSKEPNLQNIPTNKEINIRKGFIAEKNKFLISLDYSQIELRLLAHFSEDSTLIEAFHQDKDIHLETAIKIFGEEKATEYRGVAKSINFGLIYGMGARKLAETINISQKEAKEFIERYFHSFPTIKTYLEKAKQLAKEREYVETLLGRRRFFKFHEANSSFVISNYEREAINTIFQGSAADLIKLAMLEIEKIGNNDMILQIHDELIFETADIEVVERYKEVMENIYELRVPLKVTITKKRRWG